MFFLGDGLIEDLTRWGFMSSGRKVIISHREDFQRGRRVPRRFACGGIQFFYSFPAAQLLQSFSPANYKAVLP
jgi:hypothetical protein